MAQRYNSKRRKYETDELKSAVRNFNRRLRRAKRRNPEIADRLPQPKTIKDVSSSIRTKKDYEREMRRLKGGTAKTFRESKSGKIIYNSRYKLPEPVIKPKPEPQKLDVSRETLDLQEAAKNIEIETGIGRFPTDVEFISKQIGIQSFGSHNFQKIQEWLSTNAGSARSNLWQQNVIKNIINNAEIMSWAGETEYADKLRKLASDISNSPSINFLIAMLNERETLNINTLIPSPPSQLSKLRGTNAFDEQLNAYDRAIEIWSKYI